MLAEPRWFYDNQTNTMVINLIGFNSTNIVSWTGIGTIDTAMGGSNYTYVWSVPDRCAWRTPPIPQRTIPLPGTIIS